MGYASEILGKTIGTRTIVYINTPKGRIVLWDSDHTKEEVIETTNGTELYHHAEY